MYPLKLATFVVVVVSLLICAGVTEATPLTLGNFDRTSSKGAYPDRMTGSSLLAGMGDSWEGIQGFLDFATPDMTPAEIAANAPGYSFVWSAMIWQPDQFRMTNPTISVSKYTPAFLDDHNARPDPLPEGSDSPQQRARTLQWWNFEVDGVGHPDWVLYTCDRVTPSYWRWIDGTTKPNLPLDFTNPDVVDWQVRNSGFRDDSQQFFNALSADLVYLRNFDGACGVYEDGQWVQLFSGEEEDPAYAAAVVNWAGRMSNALHGLPSPRWLVANFPPFDFYSDDEITTLTANLDGVLDESGFSAFGTRIYMSGEAWIKKVQNMRAIQAQGVAYYNMNYVQYFPPSLEELDWIFASFLMAKEHSAYVLVTEVGGVRWPHLTEYEQNIGHPCSPMRVSQNVYVRDYSRGMVVVNPSWSSSYSFTLPDEIFFDLHDTPILESTLFLPTVSGKVLLSPLDRCS